MLCGVDVMLLGIEVTFSSSTKAPSSASSTVMSMLRLGCLPLFLLCLVADRDHIVHALHMDLHVLNVVVYLDDDSDVDCGNLALSGWFDVGPEMKSWLVLIMESHNQSCLSL
eukprot:m.272784 g.272784  ORF g.272784 m.272784 type:complete len:112 (+) comp103603_c0_seq1:713-1048(+)